MGEVLLNKRVESYRQYRQVNERYPTQVVYKFFRNLRDNYSVCDSSVNDSHHIRNR